MPAAPGGHRFEAAARARVLPFAVYIGFIFLADMLGRAGVAAQELRWLYAVKIAVVLAVLLAYRRHYTELRWQAMGWRQAALAVLGGVVVLLLWISLDAGWMQVGSSAGFDPRTDGRLDWLLVAVRIAGAALVVPVMEELFWRSFLLRWLTAPDFLNVNPTSIKIKPFIITVILFGFEHNLWLAGIVAGAVYSLLYMRSNNLWTAILAHGVTNGLLGVWIVRCAQWTYW